jgi:hypothetical protein
MQVQRAPPQKQPLFSCFKTKPSAMEATHPHLPALFLVNQSPGDLMLLQIVCQETLSCSEVHAYHDPEEFLQEFFGWKDSWEEDGLASAIVVLDSGLPFEGARQLLTRLRGDFSPGELPVVLLASALYPNSPNLPEPLGANEVLELPCTLPELEVTLKQVLGNYGA